MGGKHITSVSLLLTLVIIDARCLDSSVHQMLQNGDVPSFIFYVFLEYFKKEVLPLGKDLII